MKAIQLTDKDDSEYETYDDSDGMWISSGRGVSAYVKFDLFEEMMVESLAEMVLRNENENVRRETAQFLGIIGNKKAVGALIKALEDESNVVRANAAKALGRIGDSKAVPALEKVINDSEENVRNDAKEAFDKIKSSDYKNAEQKRQNIKAENGGA